MWILEIFFFKSNWLKGHWTASLGGPSHLSTSVSSNLRVLEVSLSDAILSELGEFPFLKIGPIAGWWDWAPQYRRKQKLVQNWTKWGWKVLKMPSLNAPGIANILTVPSLEIETFHSLIIFTESCSKLIQFWIFI